MQVEVSDYLPITFNNLDGHTLTREPINFTRIMDADVMLIEAEGPSEYVKQCSCKEIYTTDFEIQASEYFKCKVKVTWL